MPGARPALAAVAVAVWGWGHGVSSQPAAAADPRQHPEVTINTVADTQSSVVQAPAFVTLFPNLNCDDFRYNPAHCNGEDCDTPFPTGEPILVRFSAWSPEKDTLRCEGCVANNIQFSEKCMDLIPSAPGPGVCPFWEAPVPGVVGLTAREWAKALSTLALRSYETPATRHVTFIFGTALYIGKSLFRPYPTPRFVLAQPGGTLSGGSKGWGEAQQLCSQTNFWGPRGHLPVGRRELLEDEALQLVLRHADALWLGGSDVDSEGEWRWVTDPAACPDQPGSPYNPAFGMCDIFPLPLMDQPCAGTGCGRGPMVDVGGLAAHFGPNFPTDVTSTRDFLMLTPDAVTGMPFMTDREHDVPVGMVVCEFDGTVGGECLGMDSIVHIATIAHTPMYDECMSHARPETTSTAQISSDRCIHFAATLPPPGVEVTCRDPDMSHDVLGNWLCELNEVGKKCGLQYLAQTVPDYLACADLDECCTDCFCTKCEMGLCGHRYQVCVDGSTALGDWRCQCPDNDGSSPQALVPHCIELDECRGAQGHEKVCNNLGQECEDDRPFNAGRLGFVRPTLVASGTLLRHGQYPCAADSDCRPGLRCVIANAGEKVTAPDIAPGDAKAVNICLAPWRLPARIVSGAARMLEVGEGSCQSDAECNGVNARCWFRRISAPGSSGLVASYPTEQGLPWIAPVILTGKKNVMNVCYIKARTVPAPLHAGDAPCSGTMPCPAGLTCFTRTGDRPVPGMDVSDIGASNVCVSSAMLKSMVEPRTDIEDGVDDWQCLCRPPSTNAQPAVATPARCVLDECTEDCNSCATSFGCTTKQGYTCVDSNVDPSSVFDWLCSCVNGAAPGPGGHVPACSRDECERDPDCATCRTEAACPREYGCKDPNEAKLEDWLCLCMQGTGSAQASRPQCSPQKGQDDDDTDPMGTRTMSSSTGTDPTSADISEDHPSGGSGDGAGSPTGTDTDAPVWATALPASVTPPRTDAPRGSGCCDGEAIPRPGSPNNATSTIPAVVTSSQWGSSSMSVLFLVLAGAVLLAAGAVAVTVCRSYLKANNDNAHEDGGGDAEAATPAGRALSSILAPQPSVGTLTAPTPLEKNPIPEFLTSSAQTTPVTAGMATPLQGTHHACNTTTLSSIENLPTYDPPSATHPPAP
eukprot:TRINITY_DN13842_c0_g1_i1.p1 TRINITY_DN13842_c0_g1~~TRINITY_DN13842_c0_g1_i1.p1  ORF type:complete len:1147 (+),score=66.80 TRINITY_DN13842_c0_g1_i1:97-3537(+)